MGFAMCVLVLTLAACGRIGFDARTDAGTGASLDGDAQAPAAPGVITFVGSDMAGYIDGPADQALFENPVNVAVAPDGTLYVADHDNSAIRRVTPEGVVSTALSGHPQLQGPFALLVAGGTLYIGTDFGQLLELDLTTLGVTVRATGLMSVRGIVRFPDGRLAYSAWNQHQIRIVDMANTNTLLAGSGIQGTMDGSAVMAQFHNPTDVVAHNGDLLVGDLNSERIRRVAMDGSVTTFAGSVSGTMDGPLATAQFNGPGALARAADGTIYVGDRFSYSIRRIANDGTVTTIAGTGTPGYADAADPLQAQFFSLEGIDLSPDGRFLYIADGDAALSMPYHRIRRLTLP